MGQRGVPNPLVLVVAAGRDLNTTGQAVSALRRLASNGDNAVGMVRVSREDNFENKSVLVFQRLHSLRAVSVVHSVCRAEKVRAQ